MPHTYVSFSLRLRNTFQHRALGAPPRGGEWYPFTVVSESGLTVNGFSSPFKGLLKALPLINAITVSSFDHYDALRTHFRNLRGLLFFVLE